MTLRYRTAVDITLAVSLAYATFGAAMAYPAVFPATLGLAFMLGYGLLLFLLPFSGAVWAATKQPLVYALEFLRPPKPIDLTRLSIIACSAVTPVVLSVVVLKVLSQGIAGGDIAFTTYAVWTADVAAVLSLAWCLTHGGTTGVAFTRRRQYEQSAKARKRMEKSKLGSDSPATVEPVDRDAIRNAKIRFAVALSTVFAVSGGIVVGGMSGATLTYAAVFFALPMCLLYFRDNYPHPTDHMPKQLEWCYLSAPMVIVLLSRLVLAARQATALDIRLVAVTGVMLVVDVAAIGFLGQRSTREMAKPRGTRASAAEIVASFVMVGLRYWLYLHVFYIIGNGSLYIISNGSL
uniref:Uncharacterized protein n=1 Tax=Leersia perrieri TaxID=77586 RepID=A0A0D9UZ06_9ORYZ